MGASNHERDIIKSIIIEDVERLASLSLDSLSETGSFNIRVELNSEVVDLLRSESEDSKRRRRILEEFRNNYGSRDDPQ